MDLLWDKPSLFCIEDGLTLNEDVWRRTDVGFMSIITFTKIQIFVTFHFIVYLSVTSLKSGESEVGVHFLRFLLTVTGKVKGKIDFTFYWVQHEFCVCVWISSLLTTSCTLGRLLILLVCPNLIPKSVVLEISQNSLPKKKKNSVHRYSLDWWM